MGALLEIRDLVIQYFTSEGVVEAVNGVSLRVEKGETLGLVGETGAGKTTTALGILGLVPDPPGRIVSGSIRFNGEELTEKTEREMHGIRGKQVSMIFQDPMTALNPVIRVEEQIEEVILQHDRISKVEAKRRALEMLEMVGIPAERGAEYPHQFSGGMKQRVDIAIALACSPALLLADEPTTALDVTIQAQVLEMMNQLKTNLGTAMILITHDFGVVAETCDKVAVMYAGEIVESGGMEDIFDATAHPYTKGLFASIPTLDKDVDLLDPIPGLMHEPTNLPGGCKFHPRCSEATEECARVHPAAVEVSPGHWVRCLRCRAGRENG
ncbi:MAG: ABC transporter ATP-binding protein [Clostridiales bacterium]|jgi:peptide/nickel transport system ATP-binding protein|uniref:ABC transporter ATP-binding protein n=1 Tax=Intestinimonas massiliensis (ex Afouda et al. 2020) TaxID=1673721 RepID=A0ABS9MEC3_9FIRM|nr:ABC transporter ATP-binding protein [Intestinimonas massiliensis (ex Afouda et al. 2020)]MCG4529177.1 ABC transporter ATP-binding protein [Intestinimonas massiliensis (ex Afouda et al. 2020)]MCQ4805287.1 ABC transporter ATP-binding protein [Intestinimonas massiliensis (ex Afouda et al. 2020)]MDU1326181.1 ABC transporter ATP-binding protein [Clostridiales bacterium]